MNKPKKNSADEKLDLFQEPSTACKINFEEKLDPSNTDEQEILLRELLAIALKQSEMGLGISNEEMKRRTKLRYPFLK